ncbi:glutathione transferase [Stemphylium lycopersici]|uniref:glutathione transferase n=1 Tax=Stemphylium lycopersici TaxID=183478 RepID=A0A364NBA5_STELY|nr:glutathione s-transferase [Stemphylium lycopersici]RAR09118.1 glutathione transferase [Stemphylium lycopersici]RAR14546.1 glutathione transferase [Stemphylium lycopersici]
MANQQGATITVHWLNKSRGQRVVWLLEELNLEYNIEVYKRDANKRAGPELKAIHPLGKSPTVTIRPAGSEKDIVITESETIMEYICDHFGKQLVPARYPEGQEGVLGAETEEWMRYKFLMDYTEGSLFTILILALVTGNIKRAPVPFFLKPITGGIASKVDGSFVDPELKNHFDFLEDYLVKSPSKGEFFCSSSITAADIMIHFGLEGGCQRVPLSETSYPKLYEYMRRLQERDAYKRAAKRVEEASGETYVPFSDAKL